MVGKKFVSICAILKFKGVVVFRFFLFLLFLGVAGVTGASSFSDRNLEERAIIQQMLEQENSLFFSSRGIHLCLLKHCPEAIPTLAGWLYDEWKGYDASLTKERLISSFESRLNNETVPATFVIVKEDAPIGVISLKTQADPEFAGLSANSLWMGSLQVSPEERNQGLGQELLNFVYALTRQLGYERLYFYTSNPDNVKWYLKRGASVIEERPFRDHTVALMQMCD